MHGRTFSELAYQNKFVSDPMVITYQLGGTGQVAFNYVVSRNDDPYTLMITNTSYPIAAALNEAPIQIDQLGVLGVMAFDDYFLCVGKDSPYKSVQDIVADMKARPGEVRWSGGLIGSIDHFCFEKFKQLAGVEGPYVGFDGQSDSVTALLGGHIDVGIFTPFACAGQLASGDFIPLAAWSKEPIPGKYANVPTLKSMGYDVECRIARGILGTPNMPKEAAEYYEQMIRKIMDTKGWKDYVAANALTSRKTICIEFIKEHIAMHRIFPLFIAVAGGYWVHQGIFVYRLWANGRLGAGFMPAFAGLMAVLLSLVVLLGKRGREDAKKPSERFSPKALLPVVALALALAASQLVGLVLSLVLFVFLWLKAYEKFSLAKSAVTALSAGFIVYMVFGHWLMLRFPKGALNLL